jgi:hypothetical protein
LVLGDKIITQYRGPPGDLSASGQICTEHKNPIKKDDQYMGVGFGMPIPSQTIEIGTSTTTTVTHTASVDIRAGGGARRLGDRRCRRFTRAAGAQYSIQV